MKLRQSSDVTRSTPKATRLRQEVYLLVHDDTDCIVQQTLTKDDGVELGVHLVLIEDGEDGDWICCRQCGPEDEAFDQPDFEGLEAEERVDVYQNTALYVISRMSKGF